MTAKQTLPPPVPTIDDYGHSSYKAKPTDIKIGLPYTDPFGEIMRPIERRGAVFVVDVWTPNGWVRSNSRLASAQDLRFYTERTRDIHVAAIIRGQAERKKRLADSAKYRAKQRGEAKIAERMSRAMTWDGRPLNGKFGPGRAVHVSKTSVGQKGFLVTMAESTYRRWVTNAENMQRCIVAADSTIERLMNENRALRGGLRSVNPIPTT